MIKFLNKHFWVLLLLIVLVSYGQILLMFPWQDDHTVFFKLMDVSQKAGYFGLGPFGQGVYKYIVTPYIPIQKLFGFNPVAFFSLGITFYYLATLTVYKVFSEVISPRGGRIAGLLYACGFIASDGYIRIFNSVSTSFGIILVSLLFLFYYRFIKGRGIKWYALAVLFYFLSLEFATVRTHYLIAAVITFELIFTLLKKPIGSITKSIIRIIPFGYIFYKYFLENVDSRSGQIGTFLKDLLAGEFSKLYSFFSAVANIIFPDWLLKSVLDFAGLNYLIIVTIVILLFGISKAFKNNRLRKSLTVTYLVLFTSWDFVVKKVFSVTSLRLSSQDLYEVFLGGVILLLLPTVLAKLQKKWRNLLIFLVVWSLFNIASYAVYNPSLGFIQYHRYLAHSFLPLVGIFGILYVSTRSRLIILWGLINLIGAVTYQNMILETRSFPVKRFYSQLKQYVPEAKKGDVFYFDVADSARSYFADAFSVASMPEETAIAWQYGIDRYDIRRVTEFNDFKKLIDLGVITDINKKEVKINNIYSFFYSDKGLVETTNELKKELNDKEFEKVTFKTKKTDNGIEIEFDKPISSITPSLLQIELEAVIPDSNSIKFPLVNNNKLVINSIAKDERLRQQAFDYQKYKNTEAKNYKIKTSNVWKDNIPDNLIDNRNDTYWRADRVLWYKEGASLTIDLQSVQSIDKFAWINGYSNDTPTKYIVEVSIDNKNWKTVSEKKSSKRIEPNIVNVDKFDSVNARFVRMTIQNTLSNDSASVAEVWVVPTIYKDIDTVKAEEFLESPLGYVPSLESYTSTLSGLNYFGDVQVYWLNNKSKNYQTLSNSIIKVRYDKIPKIYNITISAGGTEMKMIKLSQSHIDGNLNVNSVFIK